jgi:hypothetical protein
MDAAKHIQPDDIVAIFSKLKINLGMCVDTMSSLHHHVLVCICAYVCMCVTGGSFPPDFVVWMEVLLGGEADMV